MKTIKKLIILLFAISLIGCSPKVIENTQYQNHYIYDTVSLHRVDSIYIKQYVKNDTIFITTEKFKNIIQYKQKLKIDTVSIIETKTISVEKNIAWYYKFYRFFTFLTLFIIVTYFGYKFLKNKLDIIR